MTWWLTAICNEIWCPLLASKHADRQNAVYIINKSLKIIPCNHLLSSFLMTTHNLLITISIPPTSKGNFKENIQVNSWEIWLFMPVIFHFIISFRLRNIVKMFRFSSFTCFSITLWLLFCKFRVFSPIPFLILRTCIISSKSLEFEGAGEMAQQLRALSALPKVLSSIPSNHIVAHNNL